MQNITTAIELRDTIRLLEERQAVQGQMMKQQFFIVIESIRPVNIIKNTFKEAVATNDLVGNILSTTLGLTAGYLSNKTLIGGSANIFRKLLGTLLQFGVTSVIAKNPDAVKSLGHSIIHRLLKKKETDSENAASY